MRRPTRYRQQTYRDPNDVRLVQIIRNSQHSAPRAVSFMGAPFDGAVLGRKGAAGGPAAIRQALSLFSNYNPELGTSLLEAKVLDLGDVVFKSEEIQAAHAELEREVGREIDNDSLLVVLGGDNSVSLPSLRALAKRFGKIGLVVIDSHFDLRGQIQGSPTSGSSYGLAIRTIKELAPRRVVEMGIHGFLNSVRYAEQARKLGVMVYAAQDIRQNGATRTAKEAYEIAIEGAEAVYFSVDLDAVDLAYVSGVSAPSVGGLSASELFEIAHFMGGREGVKCADIVELAPSLDPSGRSQIVAATALVHLITGFHTFRGNHRRI